MTNEMVEQIRSMLKDEINPVYTRLDRIDTRLDQMDSRIDGIDTRLDKIDNRFDGLDHEIKQLKTGQEQLQQEIVNLKTNQEQLQKDIITSIGEFTDRVTEHFDSQTAALNKRVFANEANIERLMKQS
jgi:archaellum component FlaC